MVDYLLLLGRTLINTLLFDRAVYQTVDGGIIALSVAGGIAFIGGMSLLLGQSVILFVNRVRPPRFLASLFLNGLLYVASLIVWAWAVRLAARWWVAVEIPMSESLILMFLTAAPMVFAFFILMPYLGPLIGRLLNLWSFLLTYQLVSTVYNIGWWSTIWVVGLGWLLTLLVNNTIGWPLNAITRRLRSWVAGVNVNHPTDALVVKASNLLVARPQEIAELGKPRHSADHINQQL